MLGSLSEDYKIEAVGYHSLAFILSAFGDMMRAYPFDAIDLIVTHCVINSNVEHLIRNSELDRQYLDFETAEPDDIKRGVTRGALSRFLNLPEETVRRRVARLVADGILEDREDGIVISPTNPHHFGSNTDLQRSNAVLVRKMFRAIAALGIRLTPGARPVPSAASGAALREEELTHTRGISRHSLTYILCAFSDMMRFYELDTLDLIITQTIVNRHIVYADAGPDLDIRTRHFGEVVEQRPIRELSRANISRFLHVPALTTRRRIEKLIERGIIAESGDNLSITHSGAHRFGDNKALKQANYRLVKKMRADLTALGVQID